MILVGVLLIAISGFGLFIMGTAEYLLQRNKPKNNEIEIIELHNWKQLK